MNRNAQFERELEQWLRTEAPASAPAGFHATVMDRARALRQRPSWATSLPIRRLGRGRGMTLLAAAALLGGGALAAASGALRLPTFVPPVPAPSVIADASPGPNESAEPSASSIPVAGPGGVWIPTGSMVTRQERFSAARLRDGRVLLVGPSGWELYDPATGTWSATAGDMPGYAGTGTSAVVLRDGRVLLGESVYDPASGTWTSTNPVPWKSWGLATVTRLRDGRVLASKYGVAMLYDPATGAWAPTGKPKVVSEMAAATLLSDGKVLVAGGYDDEHGLLDSAEVYDPVTGSWTEIANMPASGGRTATLLRDGKVLVAGTAMAEGGVAQGVARLYDPATGTWTELPLRPGIHGFDSAALLADDTVLLTKSWHADAHCATLDVYDSRTGSWTTVSGIPWCNVSSFTPLLDGTLLVAGGSDCNGVGDCVPNGAAALYVPAGVPLPPLPDFPSAPPPLFPSPTATPSPTPRPTPLPPAAGPVPPNARSWTVTVENRSSEPAAVFVADEDGDGLRLVGAATPNVVPAGVTVEVTFLFAADGGRIYVNPRPGEGGALVSADDIGIPGKIVVTADGQVGWLSP